MKFAVFVRRIRLSFFNKTLVHDLTYFHLSDLYQIWHTDALQGCFSNQNQIFTFFS